MTLNYYDFMIQMNLLEVENPFEEKPNVENEIPKEEEKEDKEENVENKEEYKYVKPEVSVLDFSENV